MFLNCNTRPKQLSDKCFPSSVTLFHDIIKRLIPGEKKCHLSFRPFPIPLAQIPPRCMGPSQVMTLVLSNRHDESDIVSSSSTTYTLPSPLPSGSTIVRQCFLGSPRLMRSNNEPHFNMTDQPRRYLYVESWRSPERHFDTPHSVCALWSPLKKSVTFLKKKNGKPKTACGTVLRFKGRPFQKRYVVGLGSLTQHIFLSKTMKKTKNMLGIEIWKIF